MGGNYFIASLSLLVAPGPGFSSSETEVQLRMQARIHHQIWGVSRWPQPSGRPTVHQLEAYNHGPLAAVSPGVGTSLTTCSHVAGSGRLWPRMFGFSSVTVHPHFCELIPMFNLLLGYDLN